MRPLIAVLRLLTASPVRGISRHASVCCLKGDRTGTTGVPSWGWGFGRAYGVDVVGVETVLEGL